MNNFPIEHDGKTYWISRSVAVVGYIFCLDNGKLFVLANKRGSGTPNYQGYWNCPCGYVDFNETIKEACTREIAEETNLTVNPDRLKLFGIEDDPNVVNQNITFRYWDFSPTMYRGQTIYPKGAEENEVEDVKWIAIENLDDYEFAFNQKETIYNIALSFLSSHISREILLKIKKCTE